MLNINRQKFLHLFFGTGIVIFAIGLIATMVYFKSRADDISADISASVTIQNQVPTAATFVIQKESNLASGGVFAHTLSADWDSGGGYFYPVAGDTTNTKIYLNGYVTDPDGAADIAQVMGVIRLNSDSLCPFGGSHENTCLYVGDANCTLGGAYYTYPDTEYTSNDRSFSCEIIVPFYAQPGTWQVAIAAVDTASVSIECPVFYDQQGNESPTPGNQCPGAINLFSGSSQTFLMGSTVGLSTNPTFDFSAGTPLAANSSTTYSSGRNMVFAQSGNAPADVNIHGTGTGDGDPMVCTTGGSPNGKTIPQANEQFSSALSLDYDPTNGATNNADSGMKNLTPSTTTLHLNVGVVDTFTGSPEVPTLPTQPVSWNINIPSDAKGICSGTIVVAAVGHT